MAKERKPRGYWTRETVVKELHERKEKGLSMDAGAVATGDSGLYYSAANLFGGWYAALAAIGEDVGNKTRRKKHETHGFWTAEQVVIEIKKLAELEVDLSTVNVRKDHGSLVSHASIFYGGWYAALDASGIASNDYRERKVMGFWTPENTIKGIREREKNSSSLVTRHVVKEDGGLYSAAVKNFGTWVHALTASGLDATKYIDESTKGYWTEERVRQEMQRRKDSGLSMKSGNIKSDNRALYERARNTFGSYKEALEQCGIVDKQ